MIKVRVYYDGYEDIYRPQYRWLGIWFNYKEFKPTPYGYAIEMKTNCATKESAIAYLNEKKAEYQRDRESEAAAQERSKKSGVVYEDVI